MRRRLRRQRQMREALLLDLGALVFELNRHGRREPELLQAKAAELTAVDEEVRALAEALGNDQTMTQLIATGVAGSCENCGSLMSIDARYCASCGAPAVPALGGDEDRREVPAYERIEDQAALATGPEDRYEYEYDDSVPPPEEALAHEAEAEPSDWGGVEHEAAPEEDVAMPEEDETVAEEDSEVPEEEPLPDDGEEIDEGVIRVTPVPAPDEAQEEPEEQDTEVQQAPAPEASEDGGQPPADTQVPAGQPPRALADDALDTAAKAIRTGIARGRAWIRARRTE